MPDMTSLYEDLFEGANHEYRYKKSTVSLQDLAHFVSMRGELYDTSDVRLFVIGRAPNGWWLHLPCGSAQVFAEEANRQFDSIGFQWIANPEESFNSLHNASGTCYLSKSPFWKVAHGIWCKLYKSDKDDFIKRIAWSNLYKIAPKDGGNPTTGMCKKQFKACYDILKEEIRTYRPTHILIISGYKHWYAWEGYDFSNIFICNQDLVSNNENKTIFVEGTAKFNLDGELIPVVITCRPEGRKEDPFVKEVLGFLRDDRNT